MFVPSAQFPHFLIVNKLIVQSLYQVEYSLFLYLNVYPKLNNLLTPHKFLMVK